VEVLEPVARKEGWRLVMLDLGVKVDEAIRVREGVNVVVIVPVTVAY